ncbi:MAG: HAMP domain-containing protein [Desulfobacteraceae bacterium]|nr:HAMP domain-containing protein [Desulfobacteraceae bacterium]MBC2751600.1 HAMP domain-containing protein [Desulfobacteraceae bacterium]
MNLIHTIKFKFTLWYLSVLSLLLVFLACGVYFTLSRTLHGNLDDSLKTRAEQLANFRDIIPIIAGGTFEEEIGEFISVYFYADGELTDISHKKHRIPVEKDLIDLAISGKSTFSTVQYLGNEELRIFVAHYSPINPSIRLNRFVKRDEFPSPGEERQEVEIHSAALVVARPTRDVEGALDHLLKILLTAIPLTIVFSGAGGVFLARKAFNPFEQITKTAQEIGEQDLSQRIKVNTKDELGRLSTTLNHMIDRIEGAFKRQKEFAGDASHELRAPLAVIQAEATLTLEKERDAEAYRKSLEVIAQESDKMSVVINQLLTLARADAGKEQLVFKKIDMAEFLSDVCDDIAILCREKKLTLQLSPFDAVPVHGDKRNLRSLLVNLLGNAVRYTPTGGTISVGLRREGPLAVVTIRDTGIGIPPEDLPHIFKRFYRVDKARSRNVGGSGLGLSICKQIIDVHKGKIEVESRMKKGSTFYVKIPIIMSG